MVSIIIFELRLQMALTSDFLIIIQFLFTPFLATRHIIFSVSGYPQEAAAKVALKTVRSFVESNPDQVSTC